MSYITTDNLTNIMAEMTDYCNAACPMCNRFDWGLNLIKGVNAHHTTLEFVKQRIGDEIISRLEGWTCQGTYGDASMNPETIDIFKYLREKEKIKRMIHLVSVDLGLYGLLVCV